MFGPQEHRQDLEARVYRTDGGSNGQQVARSAVDRPNELSLLCVCYSVTDDAERHNALLVSQLEQLKLQVPMSSCAMVLMSSGAVVPMSSCPVVQWFSVCA